jgi:hypothetical protein
MEFLVWSDPQVVHYHYFFWSCSELDYWRHSFSIGRHATRFLVNSRPGIESCTPHFTLTENWSPNIGCAVVMCLVWFTGWPYRHSAKHLATECNERTFAGAEIGAVWCAGFCIAGPLNLRIYLIAYDTQLADHCLLLSTDKGWNASDR